MLQKLEVAWQYWEILKTVTQLNDLIPSDVCEFTLNFTYFLLENNNIIIRAVEPLCIPSGHHSQKRQSFLLEFSCIAENLNSALSYLPSVCSNKEVFV